MTLYFKATQSTISSTYTKPRHLILPTLSPHAPKNTKPWLMNKTLTKSIQWKIRISTKMSQSENAICRKHHLDSSSTTPPQKRTRTKELPNWHLRLGHAANSILQCLFGPGLEVDEERCEACVLAKTT